MLLTMNTQTAESFTAHMKEFPEMYENLVDVLCKQLPRDRKSSLILDVGCGPGLLLNALQQRLSSSMILGIDISSEMLKIAHTSLNEIHDSTVFLSRASSEQLPFKDQHVDVIVSRYSLPYWSHPELAFNEMYRVLKPGGLLVLEALNADFPRWKLKLIKYKMILRNASDDVIHYHIDAYDSAYTLDEITRFLSLAQLKIYEVIGTTSEWKFIILAKKT